ALRPALRCRPRLDWSRPRGRAAGLSQQARLRQAAAEDRRVTRLVDFPKPRTSATAVRTDRANSRGATERKHAAVRRKPRESPPRAVSPRARDLAEVDRRAAISPCAPGAAWIKSIPDPPARTNYAPGILGWPIRKSQPITRFAPLAIRPEA